MLGKLKKTALTKLCSLGCVITNRVVYICSPAAQGAKERVTTVFDAGIYDDK
jgi:hypothetical protein